MQGAEMFSPSGDGPDDGGGEGLETRRRGMDAGCLSPIFSNGTSPTPRSHLPEGVGEAPHRRSLQRI